MCGCLENSIFIGTAWVNSKCSQGREGDAWAGSMKTAFEDTTYRYLSSFVLRAIREIRLQVIVRLGANSSTADRHCGCTVCFLCRLKHFSYSTSFDAITIKYHVDVGYASREDMHLNIYFRAADAIRAGTLHELPRASCTVRSLRLTLTNESNKIDGPLKIARGGWH